MSENDLEGQEVPQGKEAEIKDVLSSQVDEIIRLGFHETIVNPAYLHAEHKTRDDPSLLETKFREILQTAQLPEQISDPSKLVLVIPRLRLEEIARLQKIQGIEKWDDLLWNMDLSQMPYAIEITRGEPNQDPKDLVKETQGRARTFFRMGGNGSFDAVSTALREKDWRGLTGHELLAYARVHPDGFEKIHGLGQKQGLSGNDYFPSLVRDETGLRCQRTPILSESKSMGEIVYTPKAGPTGVTKL